jgi:hypothetical protein
MTQSNPNPPEESPLPEVRFNHLYLVLDDKTYRSIIHSDYLRIAFPGVEQRATRTAAGEQWAGSYFYCRDTYLEFFSAGSHMPSQAGYSGGHWQAGAQVGWAGLAFSVDRPGGAGLVASALHQKFHYRPHHELRQLQDGSRRVNWFTSVWLAERLGMGSFESWLMEYHPDIFAHKGLSLPEDGQLSTRAYLQRWNASRTAPPPPVTDELALADDPRRALKPSGKSDDTPAARRPSAPPGPVFSNITGATIHLDHKRAERYAGVLKLFGYTQSEQGDDLLLSAPDFELRICTTDSPAGYRLSSLRLAMVRPSVAPMTFVFATGSRLFLRADQTAEWRFGDQPGKDFDSLA